VLDSSLLLISVFTSGVLSWISLGILNKQTFSSCPILPQSVPIARVRYVISCLPHDKRIHFARVCREDWTVVYISSIPRSQRGLTDVLVPGSPRYAYSQDAVHWTMSPRTPHNCSIAYSDGTREEISGCGNRPHIVFADDATPAWLINGAMRPHSSGNGGADAFTLFRPIVGAHAEL